MGRRWRSTQDWSSAQTAKKRSRLTSSRAYSASTSKSRNSSTQTNPASRTQLPELGRPDSATAAPAEYRCAPADVYGSTDATIVWTSGGTKPDCTATTSTVLDPSFWLRPCNATNSFYAETNGGSVLIPSPAASQHNTTESDSVPTSTNYGWQLPGSTTYRGVHLA